MILWWVYVIHDYFYHSTRVFSLFFQLNVHHRAVGSSKNPIAPLPPTKFRHLCIKKRRKSSRNLNVSVTLVCDVSLNIYISYHSLSYLIVIPTTTTMEMVFCYQIVLLSEKKIWKFQAGGREFAKILRLLEQFIQTVKGQNNFLYQNAFLTCSWRFLRSEQLEFNLAKIIGI